MSGSGNGENFLAIDTAASVFSVALASGTAQWYFEADAGSLHSQLLMEIIDLLFRKASLAPEDLSAVFCMRGPGSFTGLRIGFAGAKGLALALGIPFVPVSTLDCMASSFSMWPGIVMPVIDAKKNAYFYAFYRNGIRQCPDYDAGLSAIESQIAEMHSRHGAAEQILLTGPDAKKLYDEWTSGRTESVSLAPAARGGCARELLAIAKEKKSGHNPEDLFAGPDYIRKSDAELNSGKQRENVQ